MAVTEIIIITTMDIMVQDMVEETMITTQEVETVTQILM
jgi:hypothetical protein